MAVKVTIARVENGDGHFCRSCLVSARTGESKLLHMTYETQGSIGNTYLCKECGEELYERLKKLYDR